MLTTSPPLTNSASIDFGTSNQTIRGGRIDGVDAIDAHQRFVGPGYVRSNMTFDSSKNVFISAYKGSRHLVIVAINMNASRVDQRFTIQNQ